MNHEDISALVDGEIAAPHSSSVIDQLVDDDSAQGAWRRYHLIGDVLRSDHGNVLNPPSSNPNVFPLAPKRRNIGAPLTGLAIAASVALLAVVFVLNNAPPEATPGFELAASVASMPPQPATASEEAAAPERMVTFGESGQRLNGYMVNFTEQRSRLGVPGVHPYVRIVGFEAP